MPLRHPLYVAARMVLLDALEALGTQREAIVVVGAQAVYLRTGNAGIAVAPYTTDADLVLSPALLADDPLIEAVMRGAEFRQEGDPGAWLKTVDVNGEPVDVPVDIMVPSGFAPRGGRRSVQLPPHDKMVARKAVGLEGAIVDNDPMEISALDDRDRRIFTVRVAGPAALLVAKLHKLQDRLGADKAARIADKDAADVYRLMVAIPVREISARLRPLLVDEVAGPPGRAALEQLPALFGARRSEGVRMAADALRIGVPADRVADVCTDFVRQLRNAIDAGRTDP
ncbi:MAG: GSU2403 family nucleotidyltransferase fold protein [Candidatus Dormibacteraeota bacterium]|nr:GSU2403 family nucleotidyltransferase fold protein [Candidatus Dormibacteraeota bacterium]